MTLYDSFIKNLNYEDFAKMLVKVCIINNSEPYYVTTSGQLYPFTSKGYNDAINHEVAYWAQEMTHE